jgi:4-hydroxythreonine-4-phosphate dehydrogenase
MTAKPLPIALTMGEPAGIGGELSIKAWHRHRRELPPFYLLDDPGRIEALSETMGTPISTAAISEPGQAAALFGDRLPVLPVALNEPVISGQLNTNNIGAVQTSIEMAVRHVEDGTAAALVTNPIHKETLYNAGFAHPGHTEYLAALAGFKGEPVMMLATDALRVVTVTRHISLANALQLLNAELIVETVATVHRSLVLDFAVAEPRIRVAALNPHSGEGGNMGREETEIIAPAIETLQRLGLNVTGPHPADTLFHEKARTEYDAAVCMYHDQALIPIKTIDFDRAVNITLGLPFIRTSPDHGTALDIAGTGLARESSLVAAIDLARTISANRARAAAK